MKLKKLFAAIFFLLIASASIAQTVDAIVDNYTKAMGGKEKLDKLKTIKLTGNIDIGPDMKAPFTIYVVDGKKMRFEMELQGMKMIQALNVDSGWYIQPWGGKTDPERMSPEEVRNAKDQADIGGPLFDYKKKGNTVELIGKEDMEGTDTYKLRVTKKSGDVSYIFLDATSYLQLKETSKHKFKDKEVESASLSSNYKSVDGIMFPFTMEERASGDASQGQAMNIDKIEVNPVVDESIFKMPASAPATDTKK
jgi:hypothetical protein